MSNTSTQKTVALEKQGHSNKTKKKRREKEKEWTWNHWHSLQVINPLRDQSMLKLIQFPVGLFSLFPSSSSTKEEKYKRKQKGLFLNELTAGRGSLSLSKTEPDSEEFDCPPKDDHTRGAIPQTAAGERQHGLQHHGLVSLGLWTPSWASVVFHLG